MFKPIQRCWIAGPDSEAPIFIRYYLAKDLDWAQTTIHL